MAKRYRLQRDEDDAGDAAHADGAARARRAAGRPGLPLARAVPRAAAPCVLRGRAWSGWAPVAGGRRERRRRRDVGAGRASSATSTRRGRGPRGRTSGTRRSGRHELCFRARDEAGNEQPLEGEWNVGGYGNNAVQRVVVNVS